MAQVDVNVRDLYRVLRKRKWIIMLAPLLMGLTTLVLTDVPAPVYTAESLIKISKTSTVAGLMSELVSYSAYDNMATQIMVMSSRPVIDSVAQRMNLVAEGQESRRAFEELRGRVSAGQLGSSDILAMRATGPSEAQAVALVNTWVRAYIDNYSEERNRRLNEVLTLIRSRSEEAAEELTHAEQNLFDFRRTESATLAVNPNIILDLQERRILYGEDQRELEGTLNTVLEIQRTGNYGDLLQTYFFLEDNIAARMANQATTRAGSVMSLREAFAAESAYQTATNPRVVAAAEALRLEEERIESDLTQLAGRLRALVADIDRMLASTDRQQQEANRQPELASRLEELQQIVLQKRELTNRLRDQLQDAEIQQRETADEITIVEQALTASTVPQPGRYYRALVGALIGILIGGVFAFVLEAMDTSLGTIEDVEQHISSTVLGIIPHLEKDDVKDRINLDGNANVSPEELDRMARLVTHFDPKSIGSEAYRTLRTNVASLMSRNGGKVLLISSSMIQEGKTTSCTNLATTFAQSGKRTLLIDADLRRPTVDKIFGINRVPGLTDLLLDTRDLNECYRTVNDIMLGKFGLKLAQATPGLEYLTVLPAGRIVEKPTELLNTPALDRLLEEVKEAFDIVIIDVSPVLPVADAFVLAPKVDGIILAYQIGRVARDVLKRTKIRVESVGGKVWGIILNDIQSEIDYRSGDFSYYHYRYDTAAGVTDSMTDRVLVALGLRKPKSKRRKKPPNDRGGRPSPQPPAPPPPSAGGAGKPSQEVRDIMALTDDK